ncbi:MAG: zinc chelation protein SecC [Phenylobacterium sp.]|nr:zinc chelation protein SecC [Phenylobacterium sp.]
MIELNRRALITRVGAGALATSQLVRGEPASAALDPKSAPEQMLYCTTRIICSGAAGSWRGTGFIYSFQTGEARVPVLITNKHVVNGAETVAIRLHTNSKSSGAPDGNASILVANDTSGSWVRHPDPNVDLCALPINPVLSAVRPAPFIRALDASLVPSDAQLAELDALEDVLMVGYPIGLSDEANNYPLLRRGITASPPAADFDGRKMFVIDVACFPGSSGSPVFLFNHGAYATRSGTVIGERALLLGILFAGPQYRPDGSIEIREIPTRSVAVPSIEMMTNLGFVIKAAELQPLWLAIVQHYNL